MEKLINKVELDVECNDYKENNKLNKKYFIIWTLICIFFILLISTKLVLQKTKEGRKIKNNIIYAEASTIGSIICTYDIQNISKTTKLLGNEFEVKSLFDLYIDGKKVQYSKEIKFNSIGKHKIEIKLYEKLNMDNMFKNIKDLISIEMKSEKDCLITSMISTFENCNQLMEFKIDGFNVEQVKSTNKMFYNTSLSIFNFSSFNTKNLEDMSYMFAYSSIKKFSLNIFNTIKVTNMSNLFKNCTYMTSIDLSNVNTREVQEKYKILQVCSVHAYQLKI